MTHAATAGQSAQADNERLLIARVVRGDREAARALYDAHARRVHQLIYRLCGDEETARDLTQDAFVRAFERLSTFRGDSAFSTWLHRVAVTVALNAIRRDKRQLRFSVDIETVPEPYADPAPGDPLLRRRLAQAIDALPTASRTSLIMHDIEGYTHLEIAALLGIAEGTSKTRLFDARVRLREALAPLAPGKD